MAIRNMIRLGGSGAITSGVVLILDVAVLIASILAPQVPDLAFVTLLLIANVCITFTVVAVYLVQGDASEGFATFGLVLSITGRIVAAANFIAPLGSILFALGILFLAIATQRSRVLPPASMWLWFGGVAFTLPTVILGIRVLIALGMLVIAAGQIWVGSELRRMRSA